MWIASKTGFYSVVQKRPGEFHVRARERRDLENIRSLVHLKTKIYETMDSDYCFRIVVGQSEVTKIMEFFANSITYSNFKSEIGQTRDQRHKVAFYSKIWALGMDMLDRRVRNPFMHFIPRIHPNLRESNHDDHRLWMNDLALQDETPDPTVDEFEHRFSPRYQRDLRAWVQKNFEPSESELAYNSVVEYIKSNPDVNFDDRDWWLIFQTMDEQRDAEIQSPEAKEL